MPERPYKWFNWLMNKKLILFLLIVIGFVAFLVYIDQRRANPWDSDVFFGAAEPHLYYG